MHIVKKINYKIFLPLSMLVTLGLSVFLDNWSEIFAFLFFYLVTLLWLLSILYLVGGLLLGIGEGEGHRPDWFKAFLVLTFKLFLFAIALYIGRQYMENKLFIALVNLPLQTIMLSVSSKNSLNK